MSALRLTAAQAREVEASFDNDREAHKLLDLIDAEFRSDPASVQCFGNYILNSP